jgi:peptidoglycan hydrolase-like protein with peptidoglycan-binding domain
MSITIPRLTVDRQLQAAASNQPPLKRGATGEGVSILQHALIDLGFRMPRSTAGGSAQPDGIFGSETEEVVKVFQRSSSLKPDGVVGRLTLETLEAALVTDSKGRRAQLEIDTRSSTPVG